MPSSERARSSVAWVPCFRSRTSAARLALRTSSLPFFSFSLSSSPSTRQACTHPPLPSQSGYWMSRIRAPRTAARIFISGREGLPARVARRVAEVFLDPQQLVVLGVAVGARQRAGLDLQRVGTDRDVGDGGVLGLAGAVRDHGAVAGTLGELDRRERLG